MVGDQSLCTKYKHPVHPRLSIRFQTSSKLSDVAPPPPHRLTILSSSSEIIVAHIRSPTFSLTIFRKLRRAYVRSQSTYSNTSQRADALSTSCHQPPAPNRINRSTARLKLTVTTEPVSKLAPRCTTHADSIRTYSSSPAGLHYGRLAVNSSPSVTPTSSRLLPRIPPHRPS